MLPEIIARITDKLDECDQKTPWVRTKCNEAFKEYAEIVEFTKSNCYFPLTELFAPESVQN